MRQESEAKVSASQLALYLKGIKFPASRDDIVETARSNGAPESVIGVMQKLPKREYNRANEVEHEFGQMK